jgi:nicotinamidase/pyrazinamidase
MEIRPKEDALLILDVQYDFLPGGSLAVSKGDQVIPPLRELADRFNQVSAPVYASRDWHPDDHCSFHAQGGPWPKHCVMNTPGAQISSDLRLPDQTRLISKASHRNKEAYSAFEGTDLHERLRVDRVKRLYIGGLVTEYCVLNTVTDALRLGYEVFVIEDAIRGISELDEKKAKEEMRQRGAVFTTGQSITHSASLFWQASRDL